MSDDAAERQDAPLGIDHASKIVNGHVGRVPIKGVVQLRYTLHRVILQVPGLLDLAVAVPGYRTKDGAKGKHGTRISVPVPCVASHHFRVLYLHSCPPRHNASTYTLSLASQSYTSSSLKSPEASKLAQGGPDIVFRRIGGRWQYSARYSVHAYSRCQDPMVINIPDAS